MHNLELSHHHVIPVLPEVGLLPGAGIFEQLSVCLYQQHEITGLLLRLRHAHQIGDIFFLRLLLHFFDEFESAVAAR
jgi:hypothetical protein